VKEIKAIYQRILARRQPSKTGFINRYRFRTMLAIAISITLMLTIINVSLYNITGTAKLDLSRPGYEAARKKINSSKEFDTYSFSSNDPLSQDTIKKYLYHYDKHLKRTQAYDRYDVSVMDDANLGLNSPDDIVE
jgi:hypothetical protein